MSLAAGDELFNRFGGALGVVGNRDGDEEHAHQQDRIERAANDEDQALRLAIPNGDDPGDDTANGDDRAENPDDASNDLITN